MHKLLTEKKPFEESGAQRLSACSCERAQSPLAAWRSSPNLQGRRSPKCARGVQRRNVGGESKSGMLGISDRVFASCISAALEPRLCGQAMMGKRPSRRSKLAACSNIAFGWPDLLDASSGNTAPGLGARRSFVHLCSWVVSRFGAALWSSVWGEAYLRRSPVLKTLAQDSCSALHYAARCGEADVRSRREQVCGRLSHRARLGEAWQSDGEGGVVLGGGSTLHIQVNARRTKALVRDPQSRHTTPLDSGDERRLSNLSFGPLMAAMPLFGFGRYID